MSLGKVLITEKIHPVLEKELTKAGWQCTHIEQITYEEITAIIADYVGLVVRSNIQVDKKLLDIAKQLRFVGRAGSGMELINVAYAKQKGICCFNSPEGNKDAVAEQVIGMLMCLCHNIVKADASLRQKKWERLANRGNELMGKTVGIIGYGNTGSAVAQRLQGFDVKILAYDKFKTNFSDAYVQEASLEQLHTHADVISLHIPLNETTYNWINYSFVQQFKKNIFLINASRGGILDTLSVLQALEEGLLQGVALDVFENERMQAFTEKDWLWFEKLITKSNVVITPHTAGLSEQSSYKIAYVLSQKINKYFLNTKKKSKTK